MDNVINYTEGIVNDTRIDENGFKNIFRALPNSHQPMSQSYEDSQESINITINSILVDGKYFINNGSIVQLDMSDKTESIYFVKSFDTRISFEKEPYTSERYKEIRSDKKLHVYAMSKMSDDNIILYDTAIYGFNKSGELLGEGEIDVELTARVTSIETALGLFNETIGKIEKDIEDHIVVTNNHQASIDELVTKDRQMTDEIVSLTTLTNDLDILTKSFIVSIAHLDERVTFIEENGTGDGGGVIDPVIYRRVEDLELQGNEMRIEMDEMKGSFQELDTQLTDEMLTLKTDFERAGDIINYRLQDCEISLEDFKERVIDLEYSQGFRGLEFTHPDFTKYAPDNDIVFHRHGSTCFLQGVMKCTKAGVITTTNTIAVASIPEGYRPYLTDLSFGRMQGSNNESWQLTITKTGEVRVGRMSRQAGNIANEWMPFSATWFTADDMTE